MFAEIITIGDEILIGQVIDSNSAWIAQQLNQTGIRVHQITSISDSREHIFESLDRAFERSNLILTTGGLGPTRDDITKRTLADYFDTQLVMDEATLERVKTLFANRGVAMPEVNRYQAMVPANCTSIPNLQGTAPGMWFERDGKVLISMPGVPYEMKGMMERELIPRIRTFFETPFVYHRTVLTQGVGESTLMGMINKWEDSLADVSIKLAYLPSPGIVRLRLSATGEDEQGLQTRVDRKVQELEELIPEHIFGYETETLELVVGRLLRERGKTLSTAESCTGGYIAHLITSIPGSSAYFQGSVVSYANAVKEGQLQVDPVAIESHGAVSEEVVRQMAEGAIQNLRTDYAIATSGIAGPDGARPGKPVGTVWIAVAGPQRTVAQRYQFGEHRERTIRKTALTGLNMLRKEILRGA